MLKKKIVLAGIWPRIAAHAIDLAGILTLAVPLYFAAVLPNCYSLEKVKENNEVVFQAQLASELYKQYTDELSGTLYYNNAVNSISTLTTSTIVLGGTATKVHILDALHNYYTIHRETYFDDKVNLTTEVFASSILAVGSSTSNIASFYIPENEVHYAVTLIDSNNATITLEYVKKAFENAVDELNSCELIKSRQDENNASQLFALWMLAPTVAAAAFLFTGLIPLFMPYGKTLGKLAMHLIVLNGSGYEIKKWQLIPRSIAYIALELVGGVLSFGATFLISYTMTMFMKKHRSFHDFIAYTVVADERRSFWFRDRLDELEWKEAHKDEEEKSFLGEE
ncbi:MAG: RDD family protein [Bacilli bacterium]|nr:RDD family protein [Bacilli bacterium]